LPHDALLKEGFSEQQLQAPDFKIYKPVGCSQCTDGYKGRVGLYEVLPVTDRIGHIILEGGSAPHIRDQARKDGVWDLRTSGLKKVLDGLTSLEEVNRVTVE
jgi:type IV pilus assembly protein PilB